VEVRLDPTAPTLHHHPSTRLSTPSWYNTAHHPARLHHPSLHLRVRMSLDLPWLAMSRGAHSRALHGNGLHGSLAVRRLPHCRHVRNQGLLHPLLHPLHSLGRHLLWHLRRHAWWYALLLHRLLLHALLRHPLMLHSLLRHHNPSLSIILLYHARRA
jgi:hypothetical protein